MPARDIFHKAVKIALQKDGWVITHDPFELVVFDPTSDCEMDKLVNRRQIVKDLLNNYAQIKPAYGNIERHTIFDQEQNRYQLINIGWENWRRVYGCLIHIDIRSDGKIWIQYDGTEAGIANELVEMGIPKQEIVLAYQSDYLRKLTDFAVG